MSTAFTIAFFQKKESKPSMTPKRNNGIQEGIQLGIAARHRLPAFYAPQAYWRGV
jgi:hypothetical protein